MAEEAVRAVLEQLLVALGTPKNGEPRRGALLVALTAGGALGGPLCTLTVAATGPLSRDLDPETLGGGAPRGVQELPGAPPNPPPCCGRILARAQVQRSFQICHPPPLSPARGSLWRLLHRTSLVHPEVEFHFCASIDGNVTSRRLSPEPPWAQAGTRLRVQSRHFTGPPCSRLRPSPGLPLPLPVPPPLAAAGFGGDLELLPVSALGPPGTPPGHGPPLCRVQLYLFDPAGVPVPPPAPPTLQDPSLLGDWGGFGLAVTPLNPQNPPDPKNPPDPRGCCEDEEEPVPPDVTFGVRWDPPEGDGDPQTSPEGDPKTLLVFLFLRHRDPFGGYDAGTRRLLLAQLEPTLRLGRPALARGLRALLHPLLGELRRQHQAPPKSSAGGGGRRRRRKGPGATAARTPRSGRSEGQDRAPSHPSALPVLPVSPVLPHPSLHQLVPVPSMGFIFSTHPQ
ncbi:type 2 DNA topoisomerase 6 subunit B-like isoform X2 [Vidua macroura]|uniref:type 2 DNA topoisomerase 6 subunit B-like isoform X2 n=1 Tax=Vidua macroura TaxID=187451 RepID=UPI0023A822F3|nr:type 2 DNA topoisomerase 6 subunit B-like isoform X2 [Vidua macroura]